MTVAPPVTMSPPGELPLHRGASGLDLASTVPRKPWGKSGELLRKSGPGPLPAETMTYVDRQISSLPGIGTGRGRPSPSGGAGSIRITRMPSNRPVRRWTIVASAVPSRRAGRNASMKVFPPPITATLLPFHVVRGVVAPL